MPETDRRHECDRRLHLFLLVLDIQDEGRSSGASFGRLVQYLVIHSSKPCCTTLLVYRV